MSKHIPEHVSHRYLATHIHATKTETYAALVGQEQRNVDRLGRFEARIKGMLINMVLTVALLFALALGLTIITVANAPASPKTWGVTGAVTIGHPECKDTNTINTNGMLLPTNCYLAL